MAKMAKRSTKERVYTRRAGPSPALAKAKAAAIAARRRASVQISQSEVEAGVIAVLAGALSGYAARQDWDIPVIGELGTAGTAAVAAFTASKFTRGKTSRRLMHVANAMAAITAHEIAEDLTF